MGLFIIRYICSLIPPISSRSFMSRINPQAIVCQLYKYESVLELRVLYVEYVLSDFDYKLL